MAQKPKDLRDILNKASSLVNKSAPKGNNVVASAYLNNLQKTKNKVAVPVEAAKVFNKTVEGTAKYVAGDPKKGYKDVVVNSGAWLIPYGKGFKVVDSAIKGAKFYKTAKLARGAIKVGSVIAAPAVLGKGVNSIPKIPRK